MGAQGASDRFPRAVYSPEVRWQRVAPSGPFRVVSLDLWFTTIFYGPGTDERWKEDRVHLLGEILRSRDGTRPTQYEIQTAMDAVHSSLKAHGREPMVIDPETLLQYYAEFLAAHLVIPSDQAGRAYSAVGLDEHPPQVNPEAVGVVHALRTRHIPVIAITNTARRAASWQEFLSSRADLAFRDVVTSCEVGSAKPHPELFLEAARRLGVRTSDILHVGDRWELDVDGARRAGCGAALYRGLWPVYPKGLYPETDPHRAEDPSVRCIDRLEELLEGNLLG
jgi:HAD superfamily hydrolase (TIGR01509 family)